jgi:hypothetical protein
MRQEKRNTSSSRPGRTDFLFSAQAWIRCNLAPDLGCLAPHALARQACTPDNDKNDVAARFGLSRIVGHVDLPKLRAGLRACGAKALAERALRMRGADAGPCNLKVPNRIG